MKGIESDQFRVDLGQKIAEPAQSVTSAGLTLEILSWVAVRTSGRRHGHGFGQDQVILVSSRDIRTIPTRSGRGDNKGPCSPFSMGTTLAASRLQ